MIIRHKEVQPKEVWFANFPFEEDENQSKERPVIVLEVDDETCKVLSMKVTSSAPHSEFEIELFDWEKIPLNHKSTADASSVKFVLKSDFRRRIGRLSDDDWNNITDLYICYLKSIGLIN